MMERHYTVITTHQKGKLFWKIIMGTISTSNSIDRLQLLTEVKNTSSSYSELKNNFIYNNTTNRTWNRKFHPCPLCILYEKGTHSPKCGQVKTTLECPRLLPYHGTVTWRSVFCRVKENRGTGRAVMLLVIQNPGYQHHRAISWHTSPLLLF